MGNLTATGVGGQFLHEIPILATPLVGGRVLEVEILLDVVRRKLDTGLLIGNGTLGTNAHGVAPLPHNLVNISCVILSCIVGLEDRRSNLVVDQALGAFGLGHFRGRVIEDYIHDVHIGAVDFRHGHGGTVAAALGGVTHGNGSIRFTVCGLLKEVIQLVLVEQQTLGFKGLLLELTLKLFRGQKLTLLPEVGGSEDLLALSLILVVTLVSNQIKSRDFNSPPCPPLSISVFLNASDRVIDGVAGAG